MFINDFHLERWCIKPTLVSRVDVCLEFDFILSFAGEGMFHVSGLVLMLSS
jgi:hypothetical protein